MYNIFIRKAVSESTFNQSLASCLSYGSIEKIEGCLLFSWQNFTYLIARRRSKVSLRLKKESIFSMFCVVKINYFLPSNSLIALSM